MKNHLTFRGRSIALTVLVFSILHSSLLAEDGGARAAIEAQIATLRGAIKRADAAELGKFYAVDAKFMAPNLPAIAGREAIEKYWLAGLSRGKIKDLALTVVDFNQSGTLVVTTGIYVVVGENGAELDQGKDLLVWKEEGGTWKIFRDIMNSSRPAPKPMAQ